MAVAYGISSDFYKCGSRNGIFDNQDFIRCEVIGSGVCVWGRNSMGPSHLCLEAVACCLSTGVLTSTRFNW